MSRRAAEANSAGWLFDESKGPKWTQEENKRFENALALYDKDAPDRWIKVAAMIPGKTAMDVIKHYRELEEDISDIEAGLIPIPGYNTNTFSLDWADNQLPSDDFGEFCTSGGKRSLSARGFDQERKKGIPWTEEEHRQFLLGLKKYGKGDWRSISHNFVTTRTPTQVASHAQKFFLRQLSGHKDKRRSSIHDITTVSSCDPLTSSSSSTSQSSDFQEMQPSLKPDMASVEYAQFEWIPQNGGDKILIQSSESSSVEPPCHMFSSGLKLQDQIVHKVEGGGSQYEP